MTSRVSIRVDDKVIRGWTNYRIESDMLAPADGFSMSFGPITPELLELTQQQQRIEVYIDDTRVMRGIIEAQDGNGDDNGGTILSIGGRDLGGRIVDETLQAQTLRGLTISNYALKCAAPWFNSVSLSNESNRIAASGGRRAGQARANREPTVADKTIGNKEIEQGTTRWDALKQGLDEANYLAWSTADGTELVVGLPNYDQESQHRFVVPATGSKLRAIGGVKNWGVARSSADRFSQITVPVNGRGKTAGVALSPDPIWQTAPSKEIVLTGIDAKNKTEADARAAEQMNLREAGKERIMLTVQGFRQRLRPSDPGAIFAFDKMADVVIEPMGVAGRYLIVGVDFREDLSGGEVSDIELVPEFTELSQ